jgi:hypothetical protein
MVELWNCASLHTYLDESAGILQGGGLSDLVHDGLLWVGHCEETALNITSLAGRVVDEVATGFAMDI